MNSPILLWFRKDFRLADHPMLDAAVRSGRPIIPVFILDEVVETYGAAPKWRLGEALQEFRRQLERLGSRLILRRGKAKECLLTLTQETGAQDIWWGRTYDPNSITRDTEVKTALKAAGYNARSFRGHLLFEPWVVETKQGGFFKVYSPFWRAVKDRNIPFPRPTPEKLAASTNWPQSEDIANWALGSAMNRGAQVIAQHAVVGEAAALQRLNTFLDGPIKAYKERRDFLAEPATSRLSENLAWGEISPRTIWHAGMRARHKGAPGAECFLKELVWREFAYHLAYHSPQITTRNWREEWDSFPWSEEDDEDVLRWKQGRTGIPLVDAAMRELYLTGYMHNRSRMIVGSFLTKHMMKHWRIGQKWFEDCLIDWDPASNAMGWQWMAGSGPDAAPYFRIFNPETQAKKFDPDRAYITRFVSELSPDPGSEASSFYEFCPRSWHLTPNLPYPDPIVDLSEGRLRALAAYQARRDQKD
ncbi:Deoxyribodipyrimidine photo-lyase [Roseovarius albus]|uniref:Deoxyribodipyrimidine photo-lyase n=1 Tax=Roseovarius albus TaxID=1247867 RepID=A0A1X6ZZY5_9RHOB|nr:Deoxyribodipyrimidine photo-lyase [Roseovarius albus]